MADQNPQSQEAWADATAVKTLDLSEMDALVQKALNLWEDYEAKKEVASAAYKEYEAAEATIMSALKDAGKKSYKVDGLATVSIIQKAVVRVPATIEQKRALFAHLNEIGEEVFYAMATINSQTLNSWYSQKVEEAQREGKLLGFQIPGIEAPTTRESLGVRADKKGKKNEQATNA